MDDSVAFVFMLLAAGLAGMVDAVVGGGGLIQIPALFATRPGELAATLFGTNKFASIFGTSSAALGYVRRIRLPWGTVLPAATAALACAFLGAMAVAWLPRTLLQPALLVLLIGVAAYVFFRPAFGEVHQPRHRGWRETAAALGVGGVIGFYDGFFGPGTGSFLILLFIRGFGFDFLHASACAKLVNVATNLAALAYFLPRGYWLPGLACGMALANVLGAQVGTRLALRHGNAFIRRIFLLTVSLLILRFGWDTFSGA